VTLMSPPETCGRHTALGAEAKLAAIAPLEVSAKSTSRAPAISMLRPEFLASSRPLADWMRTELLNVLARTLFWAVPIASLSFVSHFISHRQLLAPGISWRSVGAQRGRADRSICGIIIRNPLAGGRPHSRGASRLKHFLSNTTPQNRRPRKHPPLEPRAAFEEGSAR